MSREARFLAVRAKVATLEAGGASRRGTLPFGDARIDERLPGSGLPLGRWHEAVGEGLAAETGAVTGAFIAGLAAPLAARGVVVWVMRRDDLYAPGLSNLGFPVARLIQVKVRDEAEALGALEDALASAGVAAAIGEVAAVDLTQGRRLQLACEKHGATGFVIRRRPFGGPAGAAPDAAAGSAAATRWRISPAPSEPAPGEPGLGAPRWRVGLERCRGGRPGAWIMEKSDGPHPLRVVADLGDRQLETPPPFRLAG
jgi:protein ImuA